jgi:hypothetical protein
MYFELTNKQFNKIVKNHIEESFTTEEFEMFIINLIKQYSRWYDSDIGNIADYIDKILKKEIKNE